MCQKPDIIPYSYERGKLPPQERNDRETTLYGSSCGNRRALGFDLEVTAPIKRPAVKGGEAQVMGGFPKEKQKFYTEFMPLPPSPHPCSHFVAPREHRLV